MIRISVLVIATLSAMGAPAWADGDVAKGEMVFKKCAACHSAADKTNKVGPYLSGLIGRKVASAETYNYSAGMKEFGEGGAVWDEKTLDTYLADPKGLVERTKMAFPGLKEASDRADLIAFLKTKN